MTAPMEEFWNSNSSADEIHDPNIEVLHWAQVIQLQASVYQQEDAIVKDALGLFPTHEGSAADSSDPTQYCIDLELLEGESQRNNLDRNPWDEAVQACMDLVPSGREVLFSEMCSNVGLSSLVVTRHPAIGTSAHDIALAISKVVNRCVAQGTLVQWSPDRDSYMRLDTALVCKLITSEFQLCSNEPMSLARILAAIRQKVQFAGVQLHMVNEAIRDLENSHVIRRQSINTFMLA